jgi:hypothetical protein
MNVPKDAFKKFQEELAALDSKSDPRPSKTSTMSRMDHAKADFISLKRRYGLTIADVVTFFPEEEGIAYLQQLIAEGQVKTLKKKREA